MSKCPSGLEISVFQKVEKITKKSLTIRYLGDILNKPSEKRRRKER